MHARGNSWALCFDFKVARKNACAAVKLKITVFCEYIYTILRTRSQVQEGDVKVQGVYIVVRKSVIVFSFAFFLSLFFFSLSRLAVVRAAKL